MWRRNGPELFALLIFFVASTVCRADVVPISVSQQISGGVVVSSCGGPCDEQVFDYSPLSYSNTQLPPQTINQSTSASVPTLRCPVGGESADGSAIQTASVSTNGIVISSGATGDFSFPNCTGVGGEISVTNLYTLTFDLTSPSIMRLTGDVQVSDNLNCSYATYASGAQVQLTGPGVDLAQSASLCTIGPSSHTFDELFTLAPGAYTLDALSELDFQLMYLDPSTYSGATGLSLNADFTPISAIPEPLWTSMLPLLLLVWRLRLDRQGGDQKGSRASSRKLSRVSASSGRDKDAG